MRAYELIRVHVEEHDYSFFYPRLCHVRGVLSVDKVFGPWDYVLKVEGKTKEEVVHIRDDIIRAGGIKEINTLIIFSEK